MEDVPAPMMTTLMPVFGFAPLVTGPLSFVSREDILDNFLSSILAWSGIRDFERATRLELGVTRRDSMQERGSRCVNASTR